MLEVLVLASIARPFPMKKPSLNLNTLILLFDTNRRKIKIVTLILHKRHYVFLSLYTTMIVAE